MSKIVIYTDGSSKGNPGPGGWGAIIEERGTSSEVRIKEMGGREVMTTNNRMELMAAIEALRSLPQGVEVEVHTDSEYLMKGITIWIHNWQKNNWRTKDKKEVMNKDLWLSLLSEVEVREVEWNKVLGHSGHTFNERCDVLATTFADGEEIKLYDGPKAGYRS